MFCSPAPVPCQPVATPLRLWERSHGTMAPWRPVDNRANVASSVCVGPCAAVFGNSTVTGDARIEGLARVNDGATISGNVVVKDNAIAQGGANLSGNLVLGGDAEMWITCSPGTYLLCNPDRGCDGRGGESDINPGYAAFTDAELALTI